LALPLEKRAEARGQDLIEARGPVGNEYQINRECEDDIADVKEVFVAREFKHSKREYEPD
jgi:hypothetical protein